MASRAHVINDYPFGNHTARVRRVVRYREEEDPIVLPRSSAWSTGGGLIAVALAAAAIVGGSAYAGDHTEPAAMAETPTLPLDRDWQPDAANVRAAVTNLLSGPALAAPSQPSTLERDFDADTPIVSGDASQVGSGDSTPRATPYPQVTPYPRVTPEAAAPPDAQATPDAATPPDNPPSTVPNPTTTPPEAIAPPNTSPETPTPVLDPENPYR